MNPSLLKNNLYRVKPIFQRTNKGGVSPAFATNSQKALLLYPMEFFGFFKANPFAFAVLASISQFRPYQIN